MIASKILIGVCLTLGTGLAATGLMLKQAIAEAEEAAVKMHVVMKANTENNKTITKLAKSAKMNQELMLKAQRQRTAAQQKEQAKSAELERLKNENEDLRAYLVANPPVEFALWMWADSDSKDEDRDAGAANMGARAYTSAAESVTNSDGWAWCRAVSAALGSCNDDKAVMRDWFHALNE